VENKNGMGLFGTRFGGFPDKLVSEFLDGSLFSSLNIFSFKTDIRETDDAYIIDAEIPGIGKNKVDIKVEEDTLTIIANVEERREQSDESGYYIRKERKMGTMQRSFSLEDINADKIKAEMNNGVLTVICPKKEGMRKSGKRIDIT